MSTPQLRPGKSLTIFGIAGSTIAQIAPAFSFYFGMAVIAAGAGIGAPLVILVAAIAMTIVGFSVAAFAQKHPSNGSLVTFLGLSFGGVIGTATAVLFTAAYILLLASVMLVVGGWVADSLQSFYNIQISWIPLTIIFTVIAWFLTISGIDRSTRVATAAMIIEVAILLLVSIFVIVNPPAQLSAAPFLPSSISNGLEGLGLGFPLAVFLFIGFENSVALAEESEQPQRNIPRAVLTSIGLMGLLYLIVAYCTVEGFGNNAAALAKSSIPFMDLAQKYLGGLAVLAALAGFTSAAGTLLAGSNNLSRVIFNSAREGLFPAPLAQVSKRFGTPIVALTIPAILALAIALIVGIGSGGWLTGYSYVSSLGSIPLIIIYGAINVAVIFYKPLGLSPLRRYVLPVIGLISIAIPFWALIQPGQPAPVNLFPWIVLVLLILALLYSWWKVKTDPALPSRIGATGPGALAEESFVETTVTASSVTNEEEVSESGSSLAASAATQPEESAEVDKQATEAKELVQVAEAPQADQEDDEQELAKVAEAPQADQEGDAQEPDSAGTKDKAAQSE
ncbi:amino acid permease [Ktedonosporobacter rubrisoli]|uniref:amino acid permease n=1 Tax=Ktedonosporobacter rubrisoli TaxID=2509675 RepID=UPI0013EE915C|nr:amino acid permease [Ktedonosporobacter rubrisoli]